MCATFEIEKQMFAETMERFLIDFSKVTIKHRILPHTPSPAVVKNEDGTVLEQMNFSLIPSWSKERKPKFATHNARLETIKEKPAWRNLFAKKHCLVPMTTFIEPIYTGEYAGNMVKFNLNDCYLVPALFDSWSNKETNETIRSFAIITSEPDLFVGKTGHDRSPIFLEQNEVIEWLDTNTNSENFFYNLLEKKVQPKFSVEIDRKLKAGWEKRI